MRKHFGKFFKKKNPMIIGGSHGEEKKTKMGVLENAMPTHLGIKFLKTFNHHKGKFMSNKVLSKHVITFHAFTIIL